MRAHYRIPLCIVALAGAWLLPLLAHGQSFPDQAVQPPKLEAPERGSVTGSLAGFALGAGDLPRGSFTLPGPFQAASERGGLLVDPLPSYSPEGGIGEWGMGWTSSLSIERHRVSGEIGFDGADEFTSPWGRLRPGTDGWWYPSGLREPVRAKLRADGVWEATLASGTVLTFAQQVVTGQGTYAWYLTRADGVLGERTELSYTVNASGRPFLDTVTYGATGFEDEHRIQVVYESIATPFVDYRAGEAFTLDARVTQVIVQSRHAATGVYTTRWTYDLSYQDSPLGPAFYLAAVSKRYPSGSVEPAMSYVYDTGEAQLDTASFEHVPALDQYLSDAGGGALFPTDSSYLDIDSDGRSDLEHQYAFTLVRQTDNGWQYEALPPAPPDAFAGCRPAPSGTNAPRRLVRVIPEASEPHVLYYRHQEASGQTTVTVCNRVGQILHQEAHSGDWRDDSNTRVADLDRDRKPDLIRAASGGYRVLRNRSDQVGFEFEPQPFVATTPALTAYGYWVHDLNGDGRVDLIARGEDELVVWHGRGGMVFGDDPVSAGGPMQGQSLELWFDANNRFTDIHTYHMVFVDANKDGLTDAAFSKNGRTWLFVNQGGWFLYRSVPALTGASTQMSDPVVGDLSGGGDDEIVRVLSGQAHALALNRPSTGLLTMVDDGKGNLVEFGYERAPVAVGVGQRQPVLGQVTMHTSGDAPVSVSYEYENPVVHSEGRYVIGYARVSKSSNFLDESSDFYHDDDISSVVLATSAGDPVRAPGLTRFSTNTYSEELIAGVRFFRPLTASEGVREGATELSATISYDEYQRDVCPTRVSTTNMHGVLESQTALTGLGGLDPALGVAMHCLAERSTLTGTHADASLDFVWEQSVTRNVRGQITAVWQHSGADSIEQQAIAYDGSHRPAQITRPGQGTIALGYDPATGLLATITAPDGVIRRVDARDPTTDAVLALTSDRGPGGVFTSSHRFDGFERLSKRWNNLGSSETTPLERLSYEFPTASPMGPASDEPGVISVESLIDEAQGNYALSAAFIAADGSALGSASLAPQGWVVSPLAVSERDQLRQRSYRRSPLAPATDLTTVTYAQLIASAVELSSSELSGMGHTVYGDTVVETGVSQTLDYTLSLANGVLVTERSENGVYTTSTGQDEHGTTVWALDEQDNLVSYGYDAAGRLVEVMLADGTAHTIRYDGFGRVDTVDRPEVGSVYYTYDPSTGMLDTVAYVDSAATAERSKSIERDTIGRVTAEVSTLSATGEVLRFDYDYDGEQAGGQPAVSGQLGYRTSVVGTGFNRSETYNPDETLASSRLEVDGWLRFDNAWTYYANGEVKTESQTVTRLSDGVVIDDVTWEYVYDGYGRLATTKLDGALFATHSYDGEGRLDAVALASGDSVSLSYDSVTHRLSGFTQGQGPSLSGASWSFDDRGLVEQEVFTIGSQTLQRDYDYDPRKFLVEATDTKQTSTFTYTSTGLPSTISDLKGTRVVARAGASTLLVGGATYTWDDMGRMVQKSDLDIEYGPDGNLSRATRGHDEWTYVYDEAGQRLLKRHNGARVAAFVGGVYATDCRVIRPVRLGNRLVGMLDNGAFQLLATDARGTRLADTDGTPRVPTPYGVRAQQPDLSAALDFIEKAYDADLGVVRLGVRDYDPALSQFWTPDPMFLESLETCAKSPIECNLYGYAAGNPITFIDPSGLGVWSFLKRKVAPRVVGGLKVAGGAVGFVVGAGLCETGLGCVAGAPLMVASADYAGSGAKQVWTGKSEKTALGTIAGPKAQAVQENAVLAAGVAGPLARAAVGATLPRLTRGPAGAAGESAAAGTPVITAGSNREMLGQAIGHVKRLEGTAAQKADLFEDLAAQISRHSGGSWGAARDVGADGSFIFAGEYGEALVISPTGDLFRGSVAKIGEQFTLEGVKLKPVYDALKGI
ncbi:RHS repeat-associated core domain-containing protein [Haliangium sp.]|uniref:RHS repeat-associated core domain-containing protein n=1 Tax=Haliangium sp. TaxID=2663208 RepID=UPI003D106306